MLHTHFDGLRVLSLDGRRPHEVEKLIRVYQGEPFVVPATREMPLEARAAGRHFATRLLAGDFDLIVVTSESGVRALLDMLTAYFDPEPIFAALRATSIVAQGTTTSAALTQQGIPVVAITADSATLHTLFGPELAAMRVALQNYGEPNSELLANLAETSASLVQVPTFHWALPDDSAPLRETVLAIAYGNVDVVLFTGPIQVTYLFRVAEQMTMTGDLRRGLAALALFSIGPATTDELLRLGATPDVEASHPRMRVLVKQAAQHAALILAAKRATAQVTSAFAAEPPEQDAHPQLLKPLTLAATPTGFRDGLAPFDILHDIGSRIASADPFHLVLERITAFVVAVIPCDSCFIYTREIDKEGEQGDKLILRASKNPHADVLDRLGMSVGEGLTGWVAQHREPVAISAHASDDPRFSTFVNLPEDRFEAILSTPILCSSRVVGVINLQHRESYVHTHLQIRLLSTIGYLVGAEIERARLESENSELSNRLETRKAVDRAKGLLQRDLNLTEEDAYRMMQRESRQRRKSMREIAEAILLSNDLHTAQKLQP